MEPDIFLTTFLVILELNMYIFLLRWRNSKDGLTFATLKKYIMAAQKNSGATFALSTDQD